MAERRPTRSERLRAILRKPYVRLPLILLILLYVGFVVVLIFVAISSLYVLGNLVGTTTLQLLTGAISAGSAAASATAAILIWRGTVQARKTVVIDRVLGPVYSEIRRNRELLQSWKAKAIDIGLNTPFLKQLGSDWRYYTLDQNLRADLESLRDSVPTLEDQKTIAKTAASGVIRQAAKTLFKIENISAVRLWTSNSWVEGQPAGSGRPLDWELLVESWPLTAPQGLYVHSIEAVDFDTQKSEFMQLLTKEKVPVNAERFEGFWGGAKDLAFADPTIVGFRKLRNSSIENFSTLEHKLDSEIKRNR